MAVVADGLPFLKASRGHADLLSLEIGGRSAVGHCRSPDLRSSPFSRSSDHLPLELTMRPHLVDARVGDGSALDIRWACPVACRRPRTRWRSLLPPQLGQELRHARQTRSWSLRQAGRQIGIDWTYLRMLEPAQRCPSRSVAAALIEALELPPDIALWLRELAVPNAGRSEPEADADESQPPA
jgi:hypothetical protein